MYQAANTWIPEASRAALVSSYRSIAETEQLLAECSTSQRERDEHISKAEQALTHARYWGAE